LSKPSAKSSASALAAFWLACLFAALGPACSADDQYECGGKLALCAFESDEAACRSAPACEWREGCVQSCAHEQNPVTSCFPQCRDAQNTFPTSAEACATLEGCSWDPACFENEALSCERGLGETECRRRSCKWEKTSSGTTL